MAADPPGAAEKGEMAPGTRVRWVPALGPGPGQLPLPFIRGPASPAPRRRPHPPGARTPVPSPPSWYLCALGSRPSFLHPTPPRRPPSRPAVAALRAPPLERWRGLEVPAEGEAGVRPSRPAESGGSWRIWFPWEGQLWGLRQLGMESSLGTGGWAGLDEWDCPPRGVQRLQPDSQRPLRLSRGSPVGSAQEGGLGLGGREMGCKW